MWRPSSLTTFVLISTWFSQVFAQNLGKDTTLQEQLQMLDKHYGVVMTFDALNKELYMLHQGYQEGMSEYGVWLALHVWIIQTDLPRHIRDEHLEGVKHDHFYEGLNEEYQVMLAHKMENEWSATYIELLTVLGRLGNDPRPDTPHHSLLSWMDQAMCRPRDPVACFLYAD